METISSSLGALVDLSFYSVVQAIFGVSVILSLGIAIISIRRWSRFESLELEILAEEDLPPLTIVLPTWNEEKVIKSKLDGILSQRYPRDLLEIIVIDSASADSTLEIVKEWARENDYDGGEKFRIIEEKERKGKSTSINLAFSEADKESEILMMSDADCRLGDGSLHRLVSWFKDPKIGAVTGRQILINSNSTQKASQEESYRDFYTKMRVSESLLHSTPIFHGECSAYRRVAIEGHKLVENANADDSQMAVSAVRSGYRAVYDPNTVFFEMAPPDGESSRIQKVRRAQGLVRHFWRNKGMIFNSNFGSFRKILALELTMHIFLPIFVFFGFAFGFAHIFTTLESVFFEGTSLVKLPTFEKIMLTADTAVSILLLSGLFGLHFPGGKKSLTFFSYMMVLIHAQALILAGRSLHRWQQVPSVREALSEYDRIKKIS